MTDRATPASTAELTAEIGSAYVSNYETALSEVNPILDGRPTAGLAQFLKPFPIMWEKQRDLLC